MNITGLRRRSRAWGRRQLYSFFSSLGTLLGHRLGTLMTVLVLGIAMALPLGLYVAVSNLSTLDLQQDEWAAITVFLRTEAQEDQVLSLLNAVNENLDASARAISPEQGMEQFREASGFGRALDVLEENPLPWVLIVTPQPTQGQSLADTVVGLEQWLAEQDQVDVVQVDFKWLQRLAGLLRLGQALVSVLATIFSLAVIVVVANTIRLDVASRAEEIQVLSLVGAGNSFIRQPFLYSGFWYGFLGAWLALGLFNFCLYFLRKPLEQLLDAYGNNFVVQNLEISSVLLMVLAGGFLGFAGAWISVQRYLRQLSENGTLGRL
jgi:cell division transport system permease protein